VLFCDLAGSTALGETLDPERLRALLARYFEQMKAIVERHGGSVQKFIGDAVMAVFGVPLVHEDDALRAVRASLEMREALPGLGLEGRIGVMTGEVVTGTEERLATGDAVNVAARLEQAARPGEVLLGQPTFVLVREAVEVEPVEPLVLKGKEEPVPAYRLLRVGEVERRHGGLFVGRERELALVREAWERARAERRCELVTVVGDAGVGKSRLAAELLASVEARVVHGRCLPYGEGITYWPVVEVLKQLDLLPPDEAAADAIRSLLGESETATSAEEIAWAFRKTLEQAAAERPLIVLFDDIQWGEETFRDLIEHVALLSSGAPVLLLCLARPELSELHPAWPVTLRLEPLGDDDVKELIAERIPGELRKRIARAAAGNPLFIEEMLAIAGEAEGEVVVPPTLRALLAARLDQLETAERSVLERGAIEGEVFHRGAVQALAPEETQVTPRLAALVRKQLIKPDRALLGGEDGFRFRHLLLRDAAYDALPKAVRADLHERFASWLEHHGANLVELDELLGYHLSQACRYRAELGSIDEHARTLASRASKRLGGAGQRALARWDLSAAVGLLERAAELLEHDDAERLPLLVDLGEALHWAHQHPRAEAVLEEALQRARSTGDERLEAHALLSLHHVRGRMHGSSAHPGLDEARVQRAIRTFEEHGDERGLATAWVAAADLRFDGLRDRDGVAALRRALEHAERGSDTQFQALIRIFLALRLDATSAHLSEVRTAQEDNLAWAEATGSQRARAASLALAARLAAREGRFDEARTLIEEAGALFSALGVEVAVTAVAAWTGEIEELADDLDAAERAYREGLERAARAGDRLGLVWAYYNLGRVLDARGAHYDASGLFPVPNHELAETALPNHEAAETAFDRVVLRSARARELARRGRIDEAVRLAREAVMRSEGSDNLRLRCEGLEDLVHILRAAGRPSEAIPALEDLVRVRERKGEPVAAAKARSLLDQLKTTAVA